MVLNSIHRESLIMHLKDLLEIKADKKIYLSSRTNESHIARLNIELFLIEVRIETIESALTENEILNFKY